MVTPAGGWGGQVRFSCVQGGSCGGASVRGRLPRCARALADRYQCGAGELMLPS